MAGRITKANVDKMKHGDILWDGALPGFVARCYFPTGTISYGVQLRVGRRLRWYKIGHHGKPDPKGDPWTADRARKAATKIIGGASDGVDPQAAKEAGRRASTVDELCARYVADHVEVRNKPSTRKEAKRLVEKIIRPRLGSTPINKLTRADVAALHHSLRDTPRQANQALSVISKMMNLAEVWGLRPDGSNPTRLIPRFKEIRRERVLEAAELKRLGDALAAAKKADTYPAHVLTAIQLLIFSGLRVGEALALQWGDVDEKAGALRLRDAKGGPRVHPIGKESLALLKRPKNAKPEDWVFPALRGEGHLSIFTIEHAWAELREAAKIPDVRLHDLRHGVGTLAGRTGANAFLIRDKLGHRDVSTSGIYVNRDAEPLRVLSDTIEGELAKALSGKRSPRK